jgi:hypothetical protein
MSFLKETDYHGSRTYGGEPATEAQLDYRLRLSVAFAWVGLQMKKLMRLGATPTRSLSLVHDGEKRFTLLGATPRVLPKHRNFAPLGSDDRHAHMRELDTKPFPMARRPRDDAKAPGQGRSGE